MFLSLGPARGALLTAVGTGPTSAGVERQQRCGARPGPGSRAVVARAGSNFPIDIHLGRGVLSAVVVTSDSLFLNLVFCLYPGLGRGWALFHVFHSKGVFYIVFFSFSPAHFSIPCQFTFP